MKFLFLALLAKAPTHGYDLLQTYEGLFAQVLPALNAGQIYTTLARLERDGLVDKRAVEQAGKPDKHIYQLTPAGRRALQDWFTQPLAGARIKDDFYLKLVSAQTSGAFDPGTLIHTQREKYLQSLHDLNNLALQSEAQSDPTKLLLIQGAILHLRADLEWLELCQAVFAPR